MTSITDGTTTVTPALVNGYASTRDSQTLFHAVIGRSYPDVTLRPAGLRHGTLTLVFADEADASAAETMHAEGAVFQLTDGDLGSIAMSYVVSGSITRTLDDQTRTVWLVAVDFQEVAS